MREQYDFWKVVTAQGVGLNAWAEILVQSIKLKLLSGKVTILGEPVGKDPRKTATATPRPDKPAADRPTADKPAPDKPAAKPSSASPPARNWATVAAAEQAAAKGLLQALPRVRGQWLANEAGTDLAGVLEGEARSLKTQLAADTGPAWGAFAAERGMLARRLTEHKWHFYWGDSDQRIPSTFLPDGKMAAGDGEWSLEPRWVVWSEGHFLLRVFEGVFHGCHAPTGREVGLFADPKPVIELPAAGVAELDQAAQACDQRLLEVLEPEWPADSRVALPHGLFAERETAVRELTTRVWYWHWEAHNRELPGRWLAAGQRADAAGTPNDTRWTVRRMWVLNSNGHLLLPTDEKNWRGFFIGQANNSPGSGRQVGLVIQE